MKASFEQAKRYMDQPVCIEWKGKAYCGIVRDVTEKGVWLDPINITQLLHQSNMKHLDLNTADRPETMNLELSQFGFGFRPFFPFFSPFRFTPFFNPFFFRPFFFRRPFFF